MYGPVIQQGDEAPRFELPALVDGDHRLVALDEFVGEDVVILAFYPGDFNPACDEESDLDELDLFTMQKDVSVLGISADTLYSHAAFAAEYDLHVPLLSDTQRRVAAQYGVTFSDELGQELVERAVFVIDHDGVVQYAWSTQNMTELPNVDAIKDAIAETGGDDTAFARYRVGYAHYTEGRRAFTSAMGAYQGSEWMLSQSDFKRAQEEFEEAAEHFDSAVRFVDDADFESYYEQAEQKATALWQAAEWLTESASEYSSGSGAEGQRLRDDAERPLETARDIGEPIEPDEWPPDLDANDEGGSILPQPETRDTELAVDIDAAASDGEGQTEDAAQAATPATEPAASDEADEIDDAELEEIEAELTANQPDNPEGETFADSPTSMVDAPPGAEEPSDADRLGDATADDGSEGDPADDGDIEGEIDDDDLEALAADLEASQSAAEAAQNDDTDESDDSAAELGDSEPDTDEASDVPPPGSGSLEPTGGSVGTTGGLAPEDQSDSASLDPGDEADALAESESASDDVGDTAGADDRDGLAEPDGASDEDMTAIPTEDELTVDEDGADANATPESDGSRY